MANRKIAMSLFAVLSCLLLFVSGVASAAGNVTFWMMNYGELNLQTELLNKLASEFKEETGISVRSEIINWAQARDKLTLMSTGGPHPDVADMFWAYTYSDMGAGKYGPMPIEDVAEKYLGDFEKRWYSSALEDVRYKGHLYGIPWRVDPRCLAYRSDYFKEAGLSGPPDTWDELVEYGKKLTKIDSAGRVTRWGVGLNQTSGLVQDYYAYLWQAGGAFLSKDYKKATLEGRAGEEALQFLVDMVHKYKIADPSCVDPSYNVLAEFKAGKIAILPLTGSALSQDLKRTAPQLIGKVSGGLPLKNRERVTFMGGGYFGLLYGTRQKENALKWLEFLCRDENQIRITKMAGTVSPNIKASEDPMFTQDWWLKWITKSIAYGRTSQHPIPSWGQITLPEPGGVIYDMLASALSKQATVNAAISRAQKRMEELMAKTQ